MPQWILETKFRDLDQVYNIFIATIVSDSKSKLIAAEKLGISRGYLYGKLGSIGNINKDTRKFPDKFMILTLAELKRKIRKAYVEFYWEKNKRNKSALAKEFKVSYNYVYVLLKKLKIG